jgi:uncharacterized protein YceK
MSRLSSAIVVLAMMALSACSLVQTRTIVCDGVFPQWVLETQDYDGSGCAEALTLDQAPEGADWTPICTGMCICDDGSIMIDDVCTAIAPDRPWPPNVPYP